MRFPAAGEDHKFAVCGALDYASGRLIHQTSATKDGEAFAAFLDHLAAQLPDDGRPTIVVLDNVSYHKSHELREHWQRLSSRLRPLWLPAYAPQLNLIERVWRYLKDQVGCHRWWNDPDRLMRATDTLLSNLEVHFHAADDGPAFRLVQDFRQSA
jgi:transposase